MEWKKPSEEILRIFGRIMPAAAGVEKRKMFGYPCSFINGNMFMGVFQDAVFFRLSEADRQAFLLLEQASLFEPMPGRPMKEYTVIPAWLLEDDAQLEEWIARSLQYASGLPPKAKKKLKKPE